MVYTLSKIHHLMSTKTRLLLLTSSLLGLFTFSQYLQASSSQLAPIEEQIGNSLKMCGEVAQVSKLKEGTFINLDSPYPNQSFTFIVWKKYEL